MTDRPTGDRGFHFARRLPSARPSRRSMTSAAASSTSDASSVRPTSGETTTTTTTPETTSSSTLTPGPSLQSASMRSFAVIICEQCLYLEFPGCDLHGILYTERIHVPTSSSTSITASTRSTATSGALHAKCPKCSAATNNVRPFREGCRRCKAPTLVAMWNATPHEIAQVHDAFAPLADEIAHTALLCEICQSVVFPRSRDMLTTRTRDNALVASHGKVLKVSNFQLSMPHVDGCPRKGMPLQSVPLQLTKSEIKFVLDRIAQCPLTPQVQGRPEYRPRAKLLLTEQNHLHQMCLSLLGAILRSFNPKSEHAAASLKKVVELLSDVKPLALFDEWSPPRRLSDAQVEPNRVEASTFADESHNAECLLESGESYWLSAEDAESTEQWVQLYFSTASTVSALDVVWHPDHLPSACAVSVYTMERNPQTVAVITPRVSRQRIVFARRCGVLSARLTVLRGSLPFSGRCGIHHLVFYEAGVDAQFTSPETLLGDLQEWLYSSSQSPALDMRAIAVAGLQHLTVASGSLCGLFQLATSLIVNATVVPQEDTTTDCKQFDEQDWHRLDHLDNDAAVAARSFLRKMCAQVLSIMVKCECPPSRKNGLLRKDVVDCIERMLAKSSHQQAVNTATVCESTALVDCPLYPSVALAILGTTFSECIKRRSQVGIVLLLVLSELSAWQMKKMQKAEEFAGKQEETMLQLEEPFSIQVCPQFFALSHSLLSAILCRWLPEDASTSKVAETSRGLQWQSRRDFDLYAVLEQSCEELSTDVVSMGLSAAFSTATKTFSPDDMCGAVLLIITSNIRRLVLSRVDPSELGIASVPSSECRSAPSSALERMIEVLEQLISLGTKRSDRFFSISLKAAAAVEVGMEAFYPSATQRTNILTTRMGKGAVLELQVRWPMQEREQEDPRYERLLLMLQFECVRRGFLHAIRGRWQFFMHLVVQVPLGDDTQEVLQRYLAQCIQQAGFSSWQVVAGAQEISINLQRHLHWNRVEKLSHDSGAGWIRVYPRNVADYAEVLAEVDEFLVDYDNRTNAQYLGRS